MEGNDHDLIWNLAHTLHGEKEENKGQPKSEYRTEIRKKNIPKLRQKRYWLSEFTLFSSYGQLIISGFCVVQFICSLYIDILSVTVTR
jgi:hypothetical protein